MWNHIKRKTEREHQEKDKSSTRKETVSQHNLNLESDKNLQYYLIFQLLKQSHI